MPQFYCKEMDIIFGKIINICVLINLVLYLPCNFKTNIMSKEKVLGIVRHVLTFTGGIIVAKGFIEETISEELIGSVMTLIGVIWSIVDKNKTV